MDFNNLAGKVSDKKIDVIPGIRVMAIGIIAWFHIWQQSWLSPYIKTDSGYIDLLHIPRAGYLWVDMFILLSAYQLFLPYVRNILDDKPLLAPGEFYKKRALRIMPSYYFAVIVSLIFALAFNEYNSFQGAAFDFFTHLTFTQTFNTYSYLWTKLNVVLWTVGILVQFYVIFPLLVKVYKKYPVASFTIMVIIGVVFRELFVNDVESPSMWINQLPAFFDVLALGMFGAYLTVIINRKLDYNKYAIGFTFLSVLSFIGILSAMKTLSGLAGHVNIQHWQGSNRLMVASLFLVFLISTAYSMKGYRWLFNNKLMVFLASISYNYYIWHQYIAVKLKQFNLPASISQTPHMDSEKPWQWQYTIFCFLLPLAISIILKWVFDEGLTGAIKKSGKRKEEESLKVQ